MNSSFSEIKLFQVRPDLIELFEELASKMQKEQIKQQGCLGVKYMKRFYLIQEDGLPPRELTRIVKCVKYYSYWEFENKEQYGIAIDWFFKTYFKELSKLLIMPFDINCGDTII